MRSDEKLKAVHQLVLDIEAMAIILESEEEYRNCRPVDLVMLGVAKVIGRKEWSDPMFSSADM